MTPSSPATPTSGYGTSLGVSPSRAISLDSDSYGSLATLSLGQTPVVQSPSGSFPFSASHVAPCSMVHNLAFSPGSSPAHHQMGVFPPVSSNFGTATPLAEVRDVSFGIIKKLESVPEYCNGRFHF